MLFLSLQIKHSEIISRYLYQYQDHSFRLLSDATENPFDSRDEEKIDLVMNHDSVWRFTFHHTDT